MIYLYAQLKELPMKINGSQYPKPKEVRSVVLDQHTSRHKSASVQVAVPHYYDVMLLL